MIKELKSNISKVYEMESALRDAEGRIKDFEVVHWFSKLVGVGIGFDRL